MKTIGQSGDHRFVQRFPNQHKHVTFTPISPHFLMHSEKEETPKFSFTSILEQLAEVPTEYLEQSNSRLLKALTELGVQDNVWVVVIF